MIEDDMLRKYNETSDLIFTIESCVAELNKITKKAVGKLQAKKEYKHNDYIPYYRKQRAQTKTLVKAAVALVDIWQIKFESIFSYFTASGRVTGRCPSVSSIQTQLEGSKEELIIFKQCERLNIESRLDLDDEYIAALITHYLAKIIAKLAPSTMLFQLALYKGTGLLPSR